MERPAENPPAAGPLMDAAARPRARRGAPLSRHGTRSMYVRVRCRCPACKEANRTYQKAWRHATGRSGDRFCVVCGNITNEYGRIHEECRHGRKETYRSMGCRCGECRAANTAYKRSLMGQTPPHHGTASGYHNYGCRCDDCCKAGSIANRKYYLRRKGQAE